MRYENLIKIGKVKSKNVDLVVIRTDKDRKLYESEPCYHCTKELIKIKLFRINKIYYSTKEGNIVCMNYNKWLKVCNRRVSSGFKYYRSNK